MAYSIADVHYKPEITENGYRVHMKLTLLNIRQESYGLYKCVSKNSVGETEGTINVYRKILYFISLDRGLACHS